MDRENLAIKTTERRKKGNEVMRMDSPDICDISDNMHVEKTKLSHRTESTVKYFKASVNFVILLLVP